MCRGMPVGLCDRWTQLGMEQHLGMCAQASTCTYCHQVLQQVMHLQTGS